MPQSHAQVWLHIVFSTKERRRFLQTESFCDQMLRMLAHHVKLTLTNDTFGIELPRQTAGPLALLCVWVLGYPARWAGLGKCLGRWPGEHSWAVGPESILASAIPQVMNMFRWAGTKPAVAETYPELPAGRRRPQPPTKIPEELTRFCDSGYVEIWDN